MRRTLAILLLTGCSTADFDSLQSGDAGVGADAVAVDGFSMDAGADGSMPDGSMPDGSMPDGSMPDGSMPDGSVPDAGPDSSMPDAGPVPETFCNDSDLDSYGDPETCVEALEAPAGFVANDLDCDDGEMEINPDTEWYLDGDLDGYGAGDAAVQCEAPAMHVLTGGDCDDTDPTISPGAMDLCDGINNDCDEMTDEDTTVVGPGELSDALMSAVADDVLCVSGVQVGRFVVSQDLTLISPMGDALINAMNSGRALELNARVSVDGFTVQGGGGGVTQGAGVYAAPMSDITLRNMTIRDNVTTVGSDARGAGLFVGSGAQVLVEDTEISGNIINGAGRHEGAGVSVEGACEMHRVVVADNAIETTAGTEIYAAGITVRSEGGDLNATNLIVVGNVNQFLHGGPGQHWGSGISARFQANVTVENGAIVGNHQIGGNTSIGVGVLIDGVVGTSPEDRASGLFTSVINSHNFTQFSGAAGMGYRENFDVSLEVRFSNTFNNTNGDSTISNFFGSIVQTGNIGVDPLFMDATSAVFSEWDLRLMPLSMCIDAGDPVVLDADGSPCDIGPYGGPGGDW